MPGRGKVADPGLVVVRPGSGAIMMAPVSVCHQVSTTGQRPPPMWVAYHIQASGLMGSPTEPSTRNDERSWRSGSSVAPLHEGPDGGGRAVEDGDAVALDDRPPPVPLGEVGGALVHHRGGPVGQRAVDDVAVPGDPADVGRAPVDVPLGVEVEDGPVGEGHLGQVAPGGVHDPLGRRRGARGVQDEQEVLGVHVLRGALVPRTPTARRVLPAQQLVPPVVPPRRHGRRRRHVVPADATGHHHVLDARRLRHRRVHIGLEPHRRPRDGDPRPR